MAKVDWSDLIHGSEPKFKQRKSSTPNSELPPPAPNEPANFQRPPVLWIALSAAGLLLGAILTYFVYDLSRQQAHQHEAFQAFSEEMSQTLQLVERRLDEDSDRISDLDSQVEVTMERVGVTQRELNRARALAQELKDEQRRNVEVFTREIEQKANAEQVAQLEQVSSEKFEGVDREISAVKNDVESTRQDLLETMSELSDLGLKVNEQGQMIATNMDGVEELRRRGERDYITFDLDKRVKTRVAGITLELRDTDTGPLDADIRIQANDTEIEHKDVSPNAPVNFYVGAKSVPYELVFNEISNKPDRVKGYISVPKGTLFEGPPQL
jgi:hypothetical protein